MTRLLIVLAVGVVILSLVTVATEIDLSFSATAREKRLPEFSLPRVNEPDRTLRSDHLSGSVSLINVWATWCVPCRREHGVLMNVARESDLPIFGLNYQDRRAAAQRWLETLGDPYLASGFDANGDVARQLEVVGLPETHVVDQDGRIVYRHLGAVTDEVWRTQLQPLVGRLRGSTQ